MKPILCFFLSLLYSGLLLAQNTADGSFVNPSSIQSIPTQFGPGDLYVFECGDDIIFDGSASMGENGYFIEIQEFDPATWTATNTIFSDWACAPCTAPANIDVISYFGGQSPQCGQIYKFRLATGPVWATIDYFFAIDCGNNGVPQVKTFDITRHIQEDTLLDKMDFGFSGIINQNGDYVSIGASTDDNANELALATVHYDLSGTVIATPQMGVLPNASSLSFVGAEETVSGGTNTGYLAVLEQDSQGEVSLVRLDPSGTITWVDVVELSFNGSSYVVSPKDFLIDGDRAVVTGDLEYGTTIQPFILIYDYLTRSVVCSQVFIIDPGGATNNLAQVIIDNKNNNHYAIAGRTTNDLFYLEVEYDCTFAPTNTANFYPLDALPGTRPVAGEIVFDPNTGHPIICGALEGGAVDQLFIQNGINTILLTPPATDYLSLNAALFNQQGELIMAGQTQENGDQKGFILAADHFAFATGNNPVHWAKEYSDGQYPETNILDLDLAADGGYFTVGYGIRQNTTSGNFDFDFEFFDTWIMKTDEDGVLMNCNCYEEVRWTDQSFGGAGGFPVAQFATDDNTTYSPYNTVPLNHAAYYCDEWCPPVPADCQVEASATKTANPDDLCCYDLSFFIDPVHVDEFTQLEIRPLPGAALLPLTTLDPQYSFVSNTTSLISLVSNTGNLCNGLDRFFPTGTLPSVELCVDGFTGNMPMVEVDFVKCDGAVCSDTLTFDCSPCVEIVNDTLYCDGGDLKYVFDFQNTWDRPIKKLAVNNFAPPGAVFTPDTLFFPAGLPVGAAAGANTICISNVSAPDSLKFDFKALGDDECCFCISNEICKPIPICCDTCESIEYMLTDTIINEEDCCYSLDFYHCTDTLFTAVRLRALNGVTISQQSAGPGWSMYSPALSSNTEQTWFPRPTPIHDTPIPTGWSRTKVNFCLGNYDGGPLPQVVEVEWLGGSDQNVVCTDSLFFECSRPSPDSTCAQVVDTTWTCNPDGSFDLDLDVQVKWSRTAFQVYINDFVSAPAGAVFTPDPLFINGVFPTNTVVTMPTLNIRNVSAGDSICFDVALADTITNFVNHCCHVEVCLEVPPCPGGTDCEELGIPVYDHDLMGWAAATCFSGFNNNDWQQGINNGDYVMGLIDVQGAATAPRGSNWSPPMQHYPAFRADTLGQIFGLAVDEGACIYVTASSLYGNTVSGVIGFNWGVAGPGGVYKLCPDATGAYHLSNSTSLPNGGSGLGQVTYDPVHQQLFVSNFQDGEIYRLDANTLAPLGPNYDFPGYATAAPAANPDFIALGERVWAVEYNPFDGKLYFSVWGEDQRNMGNVAARNRLYSIDIDPGSGAFVGTASYVLDLPGRDYDGTQTTNNTMPISDLAFSKAGRMLVTERTMSGEHMNQPYVNWPAHGARTFSYEWSGTQWTNARLQHIGSYNSTWNTDEAANSAGGVDFGYRDGLEGCDSMIWNMGDALQFGPQYIYGIQGHEWPGNSNQPADPDYVVTNSLFIDLDGVINSTRKTQYGDVEIFRDPCCGEEPVVEPDDCARWETDVRSQGFDIQQLASTNTIVMTPPPVMTASDWWTLNVNCAGFGIITNRGDRSSNLGTNGNYLVCIDAFRVVNGDTCHVSFTYDGSIVIGPAEPCLPNDQFQELVDEALNVRYLGSQVIIAAPGLSNNSFVMVNFGDETETLELSREELPYTYSYSRSGNFEATAWVIEYDENQQICNRSNATDNAAARSIGLKLFPNPNQGNLQLEFESPEAGDVSIMVFDLAGRKVLSSQQRATAGQQQLRLDAGKLPPGTYVLRMVGSGFTAAAKFQCVR